MYHGRDTVPVTSIQSQWFTMIYKYSFAPRLFTLVASIVDLFGATILLQSHNSFGALLVLSIVFFLISKFTNYFLIPPGDRVKDGTLFYFHYMEEQLKWLS